MNILMAGECSAENRFDLVDPSAFSEIEFEAEVVKALTCMLPDYWCASFAGSFALDGERHDADLALVHKSLSHWFVVEVELDSHSLESHVLPQVRCFQFGEPLDRCVQSLRNAFTDIRESDARAILTSVPRHVAVVVNRADPTWQIALRALSVQLLTVSVFRDRQGRHAHYVEGTLQALRENLGFGTYSAPDRSIHLPKTCKLPRGPIQIEDPYGVASMWIGRESAEALWVTKELGVPTLTHGHVVQIIRTMDGRVSLRIAADRRL